MDNILLGWVWMETRKSMTAACSHNYNIIISTIAVAKATEHLCLLQEAEKKLYTDRCNACKKNKQKTVPVII